jgi:hypothetical protein
MAAISGCESYLSNYRIAFALFVGNALCGNCSWRYDFKRNFTRACSTFSLDHLAT